MLERHLEDDLLGEDDGGDVFKLFEPGQDDLHGLGGRLFGHGADSDQDPLAGRLSLLAGLLHRGR